jgi:hypothetical protein
MVAMINKTQKKKLCNVIIGIFNIHFFRSSGGLLMDFQYLCWQTNKGRMEWALHHYICDHFPGIELYLKKETMLL